MNTDTQSEPVPAEAREAWEKRADAMLAYWDKVGKKLDVRDMRSYTSTYAPANDTFYIYPVQTPALMVSGNFLNNFASDPNLLVAMPRDIGRAFMRQAIMLACEHKAPWADRIRQAINAGTLRNQGDKWTMLSYPASPEDCKRAGLPYYDDQKDPRAVWGMKMKGPFKKDRAADFQAKHEQYSLNAGEFSSGTLFRTYIDVMAYGSVGGWHGVAATMSNTAPHMQILNKVTLSESPFRSSRVADYSDLPADADDLFASLTPNPLDKVADAAPNGSGSGDDIVIP